MCVPPPSLISSHYLFPYFGSSATLPPNTLYSMILFHLSDFFSWISAAQRYVTEEGEQILHFWEYNWQTDRMTQRKYEISASEKCVHTYFCSIASFSLFFSLLSLTFLSSFFSFFLPSFLFSFLSFCSSPILHYSSFIYFISFILFFQIL